jgi:hypothetical protein
LFVFPDQERKESRPDVQKSRQSVGCLAFRRGRLWGDVSVGSLRETRMLSEGLSWNRFFLLGVEQGL